MVILPSDMIAGRLTMRALVERNQATARDSWGNRVEADFQPVGDPLPCFVWSGKSDTLSDGEKSAEIEDMRGLFPLDGDLAANDEISAITDRLGGVLVPGRLRVMGPVQRKHTHLEAALRRIS